MPSAVSFPSAAGTVKSLHPVNFLRCAAFIHLDVRRVGADDGMKRTGGPPQGPEHWPRFQERRNRPRYPVRSGP